MRMNNVRPDPILIRGRRRTCSIRKKMKRLFYIFSKNKKSRCPFIWYVFGVPIVSLLLFVYSYLFLSLCLGQISGVRMSSAVVLWGFEYQTYEYRNHWVNRLLKFCYSSRQSCSSLHYIIFLSFFSFSYSGVCSDPLKLSISDN